MSRDSRSHEQPSYLHIQSLLNPNTLTGHGGTPPHHTPGEGGVMVPSAHPLWCLALCCLPAKPPPFCHFPPMTKYLTGTTKGKKGLPHRASAKRGSRRPLVTPWWPGYRFPTSESRATCWGPGVQTHQPGQTFHFQTSTTPRMGLLVPRDQWEMSAQQG